MMLCVVFMITGGRIPTTDEMTTDEYGLRSMSDIDPVDLRMSSRQWELQGLTPSGKALDHVSMYEENAENMYQMFVNTSMTNQITKVDRWLNCVGFNNVLSIFRIVVFGLLMN